jgi:hypothetical protein
LRRTWQWHFLAAASFLARRPIKLVLALCSPLEGDDEIPALEMQIGRLRGYWRKRASYARSRELVRFNFGSVSD